MWVLRNFLRGLSQCAGLAGLAALVCCFAAVGQMTAPNSEGQVLSHLNLVLRWSRQWQSAEMYLARSGDELYVENGQAITQKVVKLEFQSALAQAELIGESSPNAEPAAGNAGSAINAQNLFNRQQSIRQQIQTLQAELDEVNRKIPTVRPTERAELTAQRDTLQGQLQLAQALEDNLNQLTSFMNSAASANGAATELIAKIQALQRTVPGEEGALSPMAAKTAGKTSSPPPPQFQIIANQENEGLVGQMAEMVHLMSTMRSLSQLEDETTHLQAATLQFRAPLLGALRATLQQGQVELADVGTSSGQAANGSSTNPSAPNVAPPAPATSTPVVPANSQETPQQKQHEMSDLVLHFKQISSATLPLSQQLILLEQSQANLKQLHDSIAHEYTQILRSLLLRVATLLIALGLIWIFSELWRRASFRYIRDARRRRQFLVLRRVVTGFCMAVVILLGFVSDFSSLATYAGLITAGVAVALQAVILSIAAYFFLVGRYGVRVGDRVTVVYNGANSVTGDVVDIGLVRFYLMELAGSGIDMTPTGRIVVFPNSVLFQTNPLFKQLPGTEYTWREVGLPLHPGTDVQLTEKELLATVNAMYASYQPILEQQHRGIELSVGVHMDVPKPAARVRFFGAGAEVVVSYPIPLRQAAELDDRIVAEVMEILRKNPSIQLADGAAPELRSAVKV